MLVRSQLIPLAVRALHDRGVTLEPRLLAEVQAGATESGVLLELESLHTLLEHCARASADRWLGLTLAAARPVGSHGIVEFFWRSSPTVRDGMATLAAHSRLLNEVARLQLVEHGPTGRASFVQRVDAHPQGMGRHANEFFVAMLVREIRALVSPKFAPLLVRFAHPRPGRDLAPLRRTLGTDAFVWDDAVTGIELDARWLDAPLVTADKTLATTLRAHATAWLPWVAQGAGPALDGRLRAVLHASVGRPLTLTGAARRLGMSGRTLQRHLAGGGMTFQAVADEVLAEHACRLVAGGELGVKETARRLGYASTAAFVRAFRRWTGATPSDWRDRRTKRRDR